MQIMQIFFVVSHGFPSVSERYLSIVICNTSLITKLPRPEYSEGTYIDFQVQLPPVQLFTAHSGGFTLFLYAERQAGKL